jgi:hypothetical protein
MANIAKAKMSAGLDSVSALVMEGGLMISGASHLTFPVIGSVAVRLMLELMGANP